MIDTKRLEVLGRDGKPIGLYYGVIYKTLSGTDFKIVKYFDRSKVEIQFLTARGNTKYVEAKHIRNGKGIRDPYVPIVNGVGYMGEGIYDSKNSKDAYSVWSNMMKRCYSDLIHKKHPSYKGCSVCKEWHNFQTFAEWFYSHESYGLGYHLDKDLLVKGNRVYSANTCSMIPREINLAITDSNRGSEGLPCGVKRQGSSTYRVDISRWGRGKYLGAYETVELAEDAYNKAKSSYIKDVAEKWKYLVTVDVYESLIDFSNKCTQSS